MGADMIFEGRKESYMSPPLSPHLPLDVALPPQVTRLPMTRLDWALLWLDVGLALAAVIVAMVMP